MTPRPSDSILILKRPRDHTFEHGGDERPISVIITTLAVHAYKGKEPIGEALAVILAGMDQHILWHNNRYWIPNPIDPLENFTDKWTKHSERATAFYEWLLKARTEFAEAARSSDRRVIIATVGCGVGGSLADRAARRRPTLARSPLLRVASVTPVAEGLSFPDKSRVADAGYELSAPFRQALTAWGFCWAVGISRH